MMKQPIHQMNNTIFVVIDLAWMLETTCLTMYSKTCQCIANTRNVNMFVQLCKCKERNYVSH